MAGDMYLENLEEFIFDEDKVVTYRWLSQTLSVHVNRAKQMLETFVERQQRKPKEVNVTYLLSGTEEKDNGVKVNRVTLVSDDNLEKSEASLSRVFSKHVYSVQQAKLKDANSLYMTDYEVIKENITQPNRYSAIKCTEAKQRTQEELAELSAQSGNDPTSATSTPPRPKMNGNAEKHVIESLKPEPQKSLASKSKKGQLTSFKSFSGSSGKSSSEKSEEKARNETATQKQETSKKQGPGSKAKGGMMAFLNKPSTTKVKKEEESIPPQKTVSSEPVVQTSHEKPVEQMKKDGGVKSKRKATKIDISDSDSEDDSSNKQSSKRRRRIIQQDSSSSESEEELSDMEDSPIPPTPPPPPMETNPSDEEEEETVAPKRSSHGPSAEPSNGKRRRRKRVLRSKTTLDEDGCMVTEKVWESDSTDASEDEAPPTKTTPSSLPFQSRPKEGGAKADRGEDEGKKKTSPGSGSGSGKAKQRSLMSFFKKK